MPGMHSAVNAKSPFITSQFNFALILEFLILVGLVIVVALVATLLFRRMTNRSPSDAVRSLGGAVDVEPPVRMFLRIGFGVLWIIDGLLQLQPEMPLGLPTQVVSPTVASAPHWLVSLVDFGTNAWLRHPVLAASGTVWLQLGLGIWLLVANRGWWSRSAGWASAAWAIGVWVFGNGFGGLFVAPISWTTGAPGAVLFYAIAGVAIGLRPGRLRSPLFALWASRVTALMFGYFALLQAWPGRGFWNGDGGRGAFPAMAQSMGSVSQPAFASSIQHWFATFTTNTSWLYNGVVVVVLAFTAVCYFTNNVRVMKPAAIAYVALALVNWVLVQDFAVFGGMGTDLNSMIPSSLIVLAVFVLVRDTKHEPRIEEDSSTQESLDTVVLRRVGASAAIGMFLLGAIPMAAIAVLSGTSADVAAATGAGVATLNSPAPDFTLTNENGASVSLATLRGKTIVMAFLDPVCTSDCPIEAQQMRLAQQQLGPDSNTVLVAVDTNPIYRSQATLQTFSANEGLASNKTWYYLTGSANQLEGMWNAYGVSVQLVAGGGMVAHAEPIYVIDAQGQMRSTWTAVTGGGVSSSLTSQSGVSLIVDQVKKAQK